MKVSAVTPRISSMKTKNYSPNFKKVYYYNLNKFMNEIFVIRDNDEKLLNHDYFVSKFKVNMQETADKSPDIAMHVESSDYYHLTFSFELEEDYQKRGWLSKTPKTSNLPIGFTVDRSSIMYAYSSDYILNGLPKEVEQACEKVREVEQARKKCEREHPNLDKKAINQMLVADYYPYRSETSKRIKAALDEFDTYCRKNIHHDEEPGPDPTWITGFFP